MLGLVMVTFLAACNNKQPADNNPVNVDNEIVNVEDVDSENTNIEDVDNEDGDGVLKSSLTINDLDEIDLILFPKGYSYEVYWPEDLEPVDEWEYVYPDDIDHSLLLPIHATMAKREVISSTLDSWMIYTVTSVTLQDWTLVSVVYFNDPVTLQYIAASVNNATETTLYTFKY